MSVIDAQVHAYDRHNPRRPWAGTLPGPPALTGDDLVAAMENVGVDRALLVSPWSLYGSDTSYIIEVYGAHPGRFGLIAPIDPYEAKAADAVTTWGNTPGAVGIRLMAGVTEGFRSEHDEVRAAIAAAVAKALPVCVFCPQQLSLIDQLARLYPDAQFVLDHLGLAQPLHPPPPEHPFADLDHVIGLAQHPNVAVKGLRGCAPFPVAHSPSTISGSLCLEYSTRSESTAACGEPTGRVLSN